VQAGVGRFGPYVVHDGGYTSLKKDDNVLEIDLDRALELIAAAANRKDRKGGERTASKKNVLKALGEHPDGGPIAVLDGKYGPYVNYQKVNVTLPEGVTPESVTLEQALAWVNAKAGKKGGATRKSSAKAGSAPAKASGTADKSSASKSSTAKAGATKKSSAAVKSSSVTKKSSTAKASTTAKKSSAKKA
jgi:DNA topoisomerase-1